MPHGRSRKMWYDTGLGLGRLSMCYLLPCVDGSRCGKRYLFRYHRMLAPFLGLCLLCGGLLLHVLSLRFTQNPAGPRSVISEDQTFC